MKRDLRIVAVNPHHKSGEVEIVIEEEFDGFFTQRKMHSIWLTLEEIVDHKNTTTFKLEG